MYIYIHIYFIEKTIKRNNVKSETFSEKKNNQRVYLYYYLKFESTGLLSAKCSTVYSDLGTCTNLLFKFTVRRDHGDGRYEKQ